MILCPDEPDERMWAELSAFEDVLYVQGIPHIRDLRRAGIATAECAVILARNTEPVSSGHFSAQDAEVVLTVLDIQACVKRSIRTLAELSTSAQRPAVVVLQYCSLCACGSCVVPLCPHRLLSLHEAPWCPSGQPAAAARTCPRHRTLCWARLAGAAAGG